MAAGRGEFFQSFLEGLQRLPVQPAPGRQQPNRGRGRPFSAGEERGQAGFRRRKKRVNNEQSSVIFTESNNPRNVKTCFRLRTPPASRENFIERLPPEILIRILSYLDVSSLFCISHVSRLFHQLSNDDILWQKIYSREFGSHTWKPSSAEAEEEMAAAEKEQQEEEERTVSRWKMMYFNTVARQEMKKWRRDLKDVNPYTGLPNQTEWVLRNMNVSWELTVSSCTGWETTTEQSRAHFFETSVILSWSQGFNVKYRNISSIQLYGVRKETSKSPKTRKPSWRSQILNLNIKMSPSRHIGKDRLIKVLLFKPGVIIGMWRGQDQVAFIMISLHFHKLVEKSLLGSPVCPYSEPADPPPVGDSDPELGLHGYTLHFVLHSTGTEIMSGHFRQLSCLKGHILSGLLEMRVINRTDLSQHRSLSGNMRLPWRSGELEGTMENCCIMSLTLLDVFQKPFWCISTPVSICLKNRVQSFDYSGRDFLMEHQDSEGRVTMKLVWLEEQKQFFLISLTVFISAAKVNQHFSRAY